MEKNAELLSQILDCSSSVIYAKDRDGIYFYINRQFEKLSGYSFSQVIGRSDLELFAEETARISMDHDRQVMTSRQPLERQELGPVAGALHTFSSIKYPLIDQVGRVIGVCGISNDITVNQKRLDRDIDQLEQADSELRENEGHYQTLFRDNLTKMIIIDPEDGAIVDANRSALSFYGYDLVQIRGKRITDINLLPNEQIRHNMSLALRMEKNSFSFRHRLSDGSERMVEVFAGPIVLSKKTYLYSMVHDVTKKLETESKLFRSNQLREEVFANINEAILIVDPKTQTIIDCNHFCQELLGYDYQQCVGAHYAFPFYDPEVSELGIEQLFRRRSANRNLWSKETLVRKKDETLVAAEFDLIKVDDQNGKPYAYIVIIRDVSKQKEAKFRLEQEVHKRTHELQDLNTALTVLLKKHEEDKLKIEESRYRTYTEDISPLLKRFKSGRNSQEQEIVLKALENSLEELFSPVSASFFGPRSLSPQESRIAAMIKEGMTTKEIAIALNVSVRTVTTHRENIRQKLHIVNSGINLRTYLSGL